jgi:nucleoside-diphosphate-sugar epimerase
VFADGQWDVLRLNGNQRALRLRNVGVFMKNFSSKKTVLITGSEGFVGRYFADWFIERGHSVTGWDTKSGNDCRELFKTTNTQFDFVIHCAANVGGRAKIDGDPLAIAENLAIDSDMYRWAIRTKQPQVVYFSSSAAYPVSLQQRENPLRQLAEIDINFENSGSWVPDQTYGWSKLTGEFLSRYAQKEGVMVHVFRPFSGYGSDQDLDYPFPSFIQRAARGENPFEIWGDGTAARDFIHITDIIEAVLIHLRDQKEGPVNLCTGIRTTFNDLALLVSSAAGVKNPNIRHLTDKPEGCWNRVGNPSHLLETYTPKVSLEEGIERAFSDSFKK